MRRRRMWQNQHEPLVWGEAGVARATSGENKQQEEQYYDKMSSD